MVIETKFNIGDELFYIYSRLQKKPYKVRIEDIEFDGSKKYKIIYSDSSLETFKFIVSGAKEENLYRTETEAYERLKELRGE